MGAALPYLIGAGVVGVALVGGGIGAKLQQSFDNFANIGGGTAVSNNPPWSPLQKGLVIAGMVGLVVFLVHEGRKGHGG